MESVNAIEIRGLTKSFKGMYALNGLNMTVPVGSIYGFIGENGSGKSTTEKLICGLLVPDKGSIKLFGKDYTNAIAECDGSLVYVKNFKNMFSFSSSKFLSTMA